ncbi:hypothetical protein LEP1GSC026_1073 [Leptospira interrogans str. 2002000623]|uniref:Uncharacterized protein n=1 Tax=Leptospira interrogans str. 2002000626 TaxID=996803 RepID=A0A829CUD8_LEPIR|nr:hypothetical protein LEP1GSC026_1073 [Leptospira interrogans str. 2002000623]EMY03792.1 hypothetical protein LEP1GSC029_3832 [Leptospira interrogans str. 2002000626]
MKGILELKLDSTERSSVSLLLALEVTQCIAALQVVRRIALENSTQRFPQTQCIAP